jgi:hypothetical protein
MPFKFTLRRRFFFSLPLKLATAAGGMYPGGGLVMKRDKSITKMRKAPPSTVNVVGKPTECNKKLDKGAA